MTDEQNSTLRLFGPPGTGKTTRLAARVKSTVGVRGRDSVRIASFSVTAAQEITNRPGVKGLLPKGAVGTLHSHAFRAGDTKTVALDPKVIADWNASASPEWKITGDSRGAAGSLAERGGGGASPENAVTGDQLVNALDLLRSQGIPRADWPPNVLRFAVRWFDWKRGVGAVDFVDMIVDAYHRARDGEPMPGHPEVLIVDEAQDLTPIEAKLALEWGRHADRTVFALDDDQTINTWRGASPELVLAAEADDEILSQSYRVPPAVHAAAQLWIEGCASRVEKDYRPRARQDDRGRERFDLDDADAFGTAYRASYSAESGQLVDALERDLAEGRDAMVLTSCGYMLQPLIMELRRRGLPFHNPHRPGEAAWNPLGSEEAVGMSTAERIYRYLVLNEEALGAEARPWTGRDLAAWTELVNLKTAQFVHGAGTRIKALPEDLPVPWETLERLFRDGDDGSASLHRATAGDLEWLAGVLKASKAAVTSYPMQVARSNGPSALTTGSRVVVGTIHSVKGATASRVYLSPDLSPAAMRQWQGQDVEVRDQTRRLFYVGMTRAFHDLVVLAPASRTAIEPGALVPPHLEVRP